MVKINGWELTPEYNENGKEWNILGKQGESFVYLGDFIDESKTFYDLKTFSTEKETIEFIESENKKWNKGE